MVMRSLLGSGGSEAVSEARGGKLDDVGGGRRPGRLEEPLLEDPLLGTTDGVGRLHEEGSSQAATEIQKLSGGLSFQENLLTPTSTYRV
jgi:hypothetical protein